MTLLLRYMHVLGMCNIIMYNSIFYSSLHTTWYYFSWYTYSCFFIYCLCHLTQFLYIQRCPISHKYTCSCFFNYCLRHLIWLCYWHGYRMEVHVYPTHAQTVVNGCRISLWSPSCEVAFFFCTCSLYCNAKVNARPFAVSVTTYLGCR